jgi:hypothetical protein
MNADEADMPDRRARRTTELCGDQPQRGIVCHLPRDHEGDHACHTEGGFARLSWRRRK